MNSRACNQHGNMQYLYLPAPMVIFSLYLSAIFLHLLPSLPITTSESLPPPPYTPIDYFLLNCGSSEYYTSLDGRRWEGDSNSKFSPRNIHSAASSSSEASEQDPSLSQFPYMTARIFDDDQQSKFTYSFPVSPGPKFLRLYFYPASYSNRDITKSFFSVIANSFTLLSKFNAYLSVSATNPSTTYLVKEFIIDVQENQSLDITFVPSPSSYAFINGIEVVSMPTSLYVIPSQNISPVKLVGQNTFFYFHNPFAIETLYRLNVGGAVVSNVDDTGMFRVWNQDEDYIFGAASGSTHHRSNVSIKYTVHTPPYTAPEIVYKTSRTMGNDPNINLQYDLTWIFPVDAGFLYLVRLHFCETQIEFMHGNQRVFGILIYNQTAEEEMDVILLSGGNGIPVYRDYVVLVPKNTQDKQDLWLALHPYMNTKSEFADAILNGVEIFKLNQSDGNLAGPNPEPPMVLGPTPSTLEKKMRHKSTLSPIMIAIGFPIGALLAVLSYTCFLAHCQRTRRMDECGTNLAKFSWIPFSKMCMRRSTGENVSTLPSDLCRYFSIMEIKAATQNFDRQLLIGAGRFGNVFKGYIDGGSTAVAIKRLNPVLSKQWTRENSWTKIHMLSRLRHVNLVALIGYCDDQDEMILVYEYMARGTLCSHLYGAKNPVLTWKQRIQICIGAAHGLNYLHTGRVKDTIIHCNMKPTNILLDERLLAKVSDFGLSTLDPTSTSESRFNTGTGCEYVDPDYYCRKIMTEKSDVYSFGVIMLEVLCGRPALMPDLPNEQGHLANWVKKSYHSGTLGEIIDPCLRGEIASECLHKFGEIAYCCIRDRGIERPAMMDVVRALQLALQVQEDAEKDMNSDRGAGPSVCTASSR